MGDQFLPCPARTLDLDDGGTVRHFFRRADQVLDRRALPDEFARKPLAVQLILHELVVDRQAAKLKSAVNRRKQFFSFVRFVDEVIRAELHRLDRRFNVCKICQHNDDGRGMLFADVLAALQSR